MNKRYDQKRTLRHMYQLEIYGPLMSDSRMAFIRWLIDQFDEGYEEPEKPREEQVRQSLYQLEKKNFIKKTVLRGGKVSFELTKLGKEHAQTQEIKNLKFILPPRWDGKWRFVMFDVPQEDNYKRDIFRDKLKKSGFFRVQQSVWVFPYDCGGEIDILLDSLHIQDCVLQFVGVVKNDKELREYFKERGFKI